MKAFDEEQQGLAGTTRHHESALGTHGDDKIAAEVAVHERLDVIREGRHAND